ncbi:HAD family hydrolase [Pseudonocardia acaciae]|uniref:HAD family hydrolase n=1 Tax=Pseudonocardia acaciae TaxID=551276 RepID=UPI00049066FF|nr:HAD family hydrolase [Pseudonocardia acaciae]
MQQPRLVASDVDGTLLGPDELPSARTRASVANVLASGTPFVLVTGRPPRWIPRVAEHLPGVAVAVCANGAVLYDIAADRVLSAVTLAPERLATVAEACARALPGVRIAVERVGRSAFDGDAPSFVCEPGYRHAWPSNDHRIVPRDEVFTRPAIKLLARHPEMSSDAMAAALAPVLGGDSGVELTFSNPAGLVEIAPAGVSKATGLATVAAEAGLAAGDAIAFGDMPNDIPMLSWVGHGVAMANGHPEVLAVADEVTATNLADGVALVLERWFSG